MSPDQIQIWKYELEHCQEQIDSQFTLVSARMTWLVISQSFLFGAFIASGNLIPKGYGLLVQGVVSCLGMCICILVRSGIDAALSVVEKIKLEREPILNNLRQALNAKLPVVQVSDREHIDGNRAPRYIPLVLVCAWVILYAARLIWPR